ncbi:MAG: ATP-binding protein [Candidatus Omnitrophica bacterium]|nr:ATP-binding protein [Candidatus Omnitrophota bacterium]
MSLRLKLVTYTAILIIGASLFFSWIFIRHEGEVLEEQLEKRGISLAKGIANNARYGVIIEDRVILDNFINGAISEEDVNLVIIAGKEGKILAADDQKKIGTIIEGQLKKKFTAPYEFYIQRYPGNRHYSIVMPILSEGKDDDTSLYIFGAEEQGEDDSENLGRKKQQIGTVLIGITLANVRQIAVGIRNRVILLTLSIIVISVIITVFIAGHIVKPIDALVKMAENVARGDLSQKVDILSKDEIGSLAKAFNKMAADLKKSRDELHEYNKTLEFKIEERTTEIQKANNELEGINKELDDFTYIVSHDLKEPLRSVFAFSKFVMEDYKDRLDGQGIEYLNRINAGAMRMQKLIEDLLEISRIGRKKNPVVKANAKDIIKEAELRLEYAIKEKNVQIIIENELPEIFCERLRMTEVFANLFSNAIKFNNKEQPQIKVGCREKGNFYEFHVKDNGPGIEEKYFDKIFQIFQRLGRREDTEGTGAGLAIVRKIIEMHNGKIWIESKVGEGTAFYFIMPKEKRYLVQEKKVGQILVEKKLISGRQLQSALEEQNKIKKIREGGD